MCDSKVVHIAEGNCVGCDSITKDVCLKCNKFATNRSWSCSIPAPEDYPGWNECKKVALCSRCDKEENSSDCLEEEQSNNTNLQGSTEKDHEEFGTLDDMIWTLWFPAHREDFISIEKSGHQSLAKVWLLSLKNKCFWSLCHGTVL